MFWFKPSVIVLSATASQFQYIICFGSSTGASGTKNSILGFQYIICFGSSLLMYRHKRPLVHISIHYMFWFKEVVDMLWVDGYLNFNTLYVLVQDMFYSHSLLNQEISIHYMFWFKYLTHKSPPIMFDISIHYMFWFKVPAQPPEESTLGFQYIICFGSSKPRGN